MGHVDSRLEHRVDETCLSRGHRSVPVSVEIHLSGVTVCGMLGRGMRRVHRRCGGRRCAARWSGRHECERPVTGKRSGPTRARHTLCCELSNDLRSTSWTPSSWAPDSPACMPCTNSASQGLSVRVFEAAPEVGGTWYYNRYPGCALRRRERRLLLLVLRRIAAGMDLDGEVRDAGRDPALSELGRRHSSTCATRITFNTRVISAVFDETGAALDDDHRHGRDRHARGSASWRPVRCRRR